MCNLKTQAGKYFIISIFHLISNDSGRIPCNDAICRHIGYHNGIGSYDCMVTYMDVTKNNSTCPNKDIISNRWR